MLAHFDPAQREKVIDEPRHARGLLAHDAEKARPCYRIVAGAPLQGLDEADERSERRAQLMARIGNEIRAHAPKPVLVGEVAQRNDDARSVLVRRGLRHGRERNPNAPVERNALLDFH